MGIEETFVQRYGNWAMVAGAAAGIGEAWSEQLAQRGLNLVLVALEEEALATLAGRLEAQYNIEVRTLAADLASEECLELVKEKTQDICIGILVYNACFSVIGEYKDLQLEQKHRMLAVNCQAPVDFLDHFMRPMREEDRGAIILMSSLSGLQGTAMVGLYAATKAFTTVLGESLWYELQSTGVDVLTVMAGATATPTFLELTPDIKQGKVFPLQPARVVEEALAALGKKPVVVPGRINRLVSFITRHFMSRLAAVRFISRNTVEVYRQ